jgi:hypothetical protein
LVIALTQRGLITISQLLNVGLSDGTVDRFMRIGWLHRVHQGVYSIVPVSLLTVHGRRLAAVLACGPGAALSHLSSIAQFGLERGSPSVIHVTVPTRAGRGRPGIRIHRSGTLRPGDVTVVDGIPCTTLARAMLDVADELPLRRVERLLDQAVALDLFDLGALEEQIEHARPGRHRAAANLHRALTEHRPGSTATDGEIGERMLAIIRSVGLPEPEVQAWLDLGDGEPMLRPDFLWRESRVILETDGAVHRRGRRVAADARRDQRAARAGWQTLRATWAQIAGEPIRLGGDAARRRQQPFVREGGVEAIAADDPLTQAQLLRDGVGDPLAEAWKQRAGPLGLARQRGHLDVG